MKEKRLVTLLYNLLKMNNLVDFLDSKDRVTTVNFIFPGELNVNEGPDLQNAKFIINNSIIVGDIEFHINSIDWIRHHHYIDEKYNNVKLHIVFNFNSKFRIEDAHHRRIKTLSLKNHKELFNSIEQEKYKYEHLYSQLPCNYLLKREKNQEIVDNIFKYLGIKQISLKIDRYKKNLKTYLSKYNNVIDAYNQILYLALLRSFGYEKNKFIFENFGKRIEYKRIKLAIQKHKSESIITYFLKDIKKARNMPCNSPSKRLSQLLNFLKNNGSLLENILYIILETNSFNNITEKFRKIVNLDNPYKIGKQRIKIIIYNAVFPVIYLYAKDNKDTKLKNSIFRYWYNCNGFENNHIIKRIGTILSYNRTNKNSEIQLQGLMFLYNNFCKYKMCEECPLYKNLR